MNMQNNMNLRKITWWWC